jgi:hypothetical protein
MTATRTLRRLALAASMALIAGCGGTTPEVDTAETIKTDPAAKPAPTPAATPEAPPAKEAPKG